MSQDGEAISATSWIISLLFMSQLISIVSIVFYSFHNRLVSLQGINSKPHNDKLVCMYPIQPELFEPQSIVSNELFSLFRNCLHNEFPPKDCLYNELM